MSQINQWQQLPTPPQQQPQPMSVLLPPGWTQVYDQQSSHYYFFNTQTGESQWTPPNTNANMPLPQQPPPTNFLPPAPQSQPQQLQHTPPPVYQTQPQMYQTSGGYQNYPNLYQAQAQYPQPQQANVQVPVIQNALPAVSLYSPQIASGVQPVVQPVQTMVQPVQMMATVQTVQPLIITTGGAGQGVVISQVLDAKGIAEKVRSAIAPLMPLSDVYFSPNIPEKKLKNARKKCKVPDTVEVVVLIDATVFGSADNAMLFTSNGIYTHSDWTCQSSGAKHAPYKTITASPVKVTGKDELQVIPGMYFDCSGCSQKCDTLIKMINAVMNALRPHTY